MNGSTPTATAAAKLGPCLYGRQTRTGGCSCFRYKRKRGQKHAICTCGHSDHWHEVGGVSVVLTETDVRVAFDALRARLVFEVEQQTAALEKVVLRGLARRKDKEERDAQIDALDRAGLLSPEDAIAAKSNGVFRNAAEVRKAAASVPWPDEEVEPHAGADPAPAALALAATLAEHGPCDRRTLLVRAVYSHKTKNVQTALAWLAHEGWLVRQGDVVDLADGYRHLVTREARGRVLLPGEPLREAWCRKLPHAAAVVLRTLACSSEPLTRGEIADATAAHGGPEGGYSLATKNFQSALSRLASLGLLEHVPLAGGVVGFRIHPDLKEGHADE